MKITSPATRTTKKTLAVALSVLLVGGVSYGVYASQKDLWPFSSNNTKMASDNQVNDTDEVNPPEQADESDSQSTKKSYVEESKSSEPQTSTTSSEKEKVDVGVSFADIYDGKLEVRAFTSGVIESGTCKVVAKHTDNGSVVTESSQAFIDASTTQCAAVYIPVEKLSAGEWRVYVEFSSESHRGVSESRKVTIS